ncbi:hypothetical protein G5I_03711 [Acromyrmex echinatior]|uniref:Uncharacterized protein n=1 Tax=Acromyrmex echinatior TaxID=103372 RepID=F4WDQ3_ACREC|nr:hypothetical protein G5I_03711 [Acromyrmex echinatior]
MDNSPPMILILPYLMKVITSNNLRKVIAVTHHTLQRLNYSSYYVTSLWKRLTWYAQFEQTPFASRSTVQTQICQLRRNKLLRLISMHLHQIHYVSFSLFIWKHGATLTVKCLEDFVELYVGISLKFTVPSALALRTVSDRRLKSLDVQDYVPDKIVKIKAVGRTFNNSRSDAPTIVEGTAHRAHDTRAARSENGLAGAPRRSSLEVVPARDEWGRSLLLAMLLRARIIGLTCQVLASDLAVHVTTTALDINVQVTFRAFPHVTWSLADIRIIYSEKAKQLNWSVRLLDPIPVLLLKVSVQEHFSELEHFSEVLRKFISFLEFFIYILMPLRNVNPENCVSSCGCYDDDSCGVDGGGDVLDAASERLSPADFDGLLGGPRAAPATSNANLWLVVVAPGTSWTRPTTSTTAPNNRHTTTACSPDIYRQRSSSDSCHLDRHRNTYPCNAVNFLFNL